MGEITKVIKTAESYVGAKEGDKKYKALIDAYNNATDNKKYDGQGCCEVACAFFILALGARRAKELIPVTNYANGQARMWKDGLSKTPKIGSLVYFASNKEIDHVELVVDIKGTKMITVDGNANHSVIKRTRYTTNSSIKGYGIPKYNANKSVLDDTWFHSAIESVVIKKGSQGELVLWLEEYLHTAGYYDGYLDSVFGNALDAAVKAYQKKHGLYVDGICGKHFWSYILL